MDYRGKSSIVGINNNNPGNLVKSAVAWLGKVPHNLNTSTKFEQFESMEYGVRALMRNLRTYFVKYKRNTVSKIISNWTATNKDNYISFVCGKLGVQKNTVLSFNKKTCFDLTKAIIEFECTAGGLALITDNILDVGYGMLDQSSPNEQETEQKYEVQETNNGTILLIILLLLLVFSPKLYSYYQEWRLKRKNKNEN